MASSVPEDLIAALTGRIHAFTRGDPGPVSDLRAAAEARELLSSVRRADGAVPLDAMRVVAWLHWCRYQALPEGDTQDDLRAALELFAPIAVVDAQAVPEPVLRYLADSGISADPGRQTYGEIVDLLRRACVPAIR